MKTTNNFHNKVTLAGIGMGVFFPILSFAIDFMHKSLPITLESIGYILKTNPIQWIILSAPLILGGTFYYLGSLIVNRETKLTEFAHKEGNQLTIIETFINHIDDASFQINTDEIVEKNFINKLIKFKKQILTNKEIETKRNWISDGLSIFIEIIRSNNQNLIDCCKNSNAFIIKYLNANQGAIYVLKKDQNNLEYLEAISTYAYAREKFNESKFYKGEGLLGQLIAEKAPIYMTDIPKNYTAITSGLGQATPSCIYIVPLLSNEQLHGAIEIASFEILDDYKLEWVTKISENLASTIANITTNERTRKLLEESQQKEEELKSREEELRQNMEELFATQEEQNRLHQVMVKNEAELKKKLNEALLKLEN